MSNVSEAVAKLPPEQEAIRAKCFHPSGTFVEFNKKEIEQSIPERFEKIVRMYPDRLAVKMDEHYLTYDQLNRAADIVAHAILEKCDQRSKPVALLFDQSLAVIPAILGTLKAGKFYVPLDATLPMSRAEEILLDSTADLLVTNTKNLPLATMLAQGKRQLINIDDHELDAATENLNVPITPDALAYIVYTSGSTGRPKGVAQSHRYVLYHVFDYVESFHICFEDRISLVFPWSFNGGTHIIYSTLLNGAALYPFDVKVNGLDHLARSLVDHKITVYHSTATVLRQLLSTVEPNERFENLRLVRFGGDAVTAADIRLYQTHFKQNCVMVNSFAATESGIICRYFSDKKTVVPDGEVPVGYAAYEKDILLLDDGGKAVGFGQIGEIAVKSRYLSQGYWRQPNLTAAKFVPALDERVGRVYLTGDLGRMAEDGCLYHLGRKDFQVKIRGYRVDFAEVETALLYHKAVKEVAVTGREDDQGNSRLIAYFIPAEKFVPSVNELRSFLKQTLPDYMIPSAFVSLESLPLTPNGKINRRLLPDPGNARPELDTPYAPPRTSIEEVLVKIWAEALSVDRVGIRDNFFDLGGHSLLVVKLFAEIEKTLGRRLSPATIFQAPTIEQLAAILTQEESSESQFALWSTYPSSVVPFQATGSNPPLFWFNWGPWDFRLHRHLGSDQPVYGLQHQSQDGHRALHTSIETMAAHYIREMRAVQAQGPYVLGGLCIGGVVAFEMAQQLQKQGQEVALLILLDPTNPRSGKSSSAHVYPRSLSSYITWFRNKVDRHLRELAPLATEEKLSYALVRVNGRIMGLREKIGWMGRIVLCEVFKRPLPLDLRTHYIVSIYSRARRAYVPQRYRGPTILFKTQGRYSDGESGWENHLAANELEIQELDTDHDNIFREPYVKTFAEVLKTRLSDAQLTASAHENSLVYSSVA